MQESGLHRQGRSGLNGRILQRSLQRFLTGQDGTVTVEFVILLPIMLGIMVLIVSASLLYAAASDVQQLAHELARAGIWHFSEQANLSGD